MTLMQREREIREEAREREKINLVIKMLKKGYGKQQIVELFDDVSEEWLENLINEYKKSN